MFLPTGVKIDEPLSCKSGGIPCVKFRFISCNKQERWKSSPRWHYCTQYAIRQTKHDP